HRDLDDLLPIQRHADCLAHGGIVKWGPRRVGVKHDYAADGWEPVVMMRRVLCDVGFLDIGDEGRRPVDFVVQERQGQRVTIAERREAQATDERPSRLPVVWISVQLPVLVLKDRNLGERTSADWLL